MIKKSSILKFILVFGIFYHYLQVIIYDLFGFESLSGTIAVVISILLLFSNIKLLKVKLDLIDKLFIVWALWALLGVKYWSVPSFYFGLPASILFSLFGINVFIFTKNIVKRVSINYVLKTFILAGFLLAVFSYVLLNIVGISEDGRLETKMVNANTLAYFCLLSVFVLLIFWKLNSKTRKRNLYLLLVFISLNTVIILSGSRKIFLGELIFLALIFINYLRSIVSLNPIKLFASLILIGSISVAGWNLLSKETLGLRLIEAFEQEQSARKAEESLAGRGSHYIQGAQAFMEHPIIGVGLGNINKYFNTRLKSHSEYISMYAETGAVGFILYFLAYGHLIKKIIKSRREQSKREKEISYVLLVSIFVILLIGFGRWNYDSFLNWAYIGLVASFMKFKHLKYV